MEIETEIKQMIGIIPTEEEPVEEQLTTNDQEVQKEDNKKSSYKNK